MFFESFIYTINMLMIQNMLKTCVLDVRMDVPISRLDAAAAVAGAPAIYHLQAFSLSAQEIDFCWKGNTLYQERNTFLLERKYNLL